MPDLKGMFQDRVNNQQNALQIETDKRLKKIADQLIKKIENEIKHGKKGLVIDLWCSRKCATDYISTSPEYRRIHEICAATDINMRIEFIRYGRGHSTILEYLNEDSHFEGQFIISFDRPYKDSPDAGIFDIPTPQSLTLADKVAALSSDELQKLLKDLTEKRPDDVATALPPPKTGGMRL